MSFTNNTVMTILVEAGENFDVTGHHPVLAGLDPTGEPLYIAINDHPGHHFHIFTCIKDGASHAAFINEDGEMEIIHHFHILVLRHDPIDSSPISTPEGAMDPTGPVFWLNYWPKKDPSLPHDLKLTEIEDELDCIFKVNPRQVNSDLEVCSNET